MVQGHLLPFIRTTGAGDLMCGMVITTNYTMLYT